MKNFNKKGFTLTEIIVVTAIASLIFLSVFSFGDSIFSFNSNSQKNLSAQASARRVLKNMVKELRSASPSSLGAYPISLASTTAVTFFVDLDSDGYKEQVRYFLEGTELKKGTIKPSGTPLIYDPADEEVAVLIKDINNGVTPIFEYFDSSYNGTGSSLVQPVQITQVRLIRITAIIEKDPNKSLGPFIVTSQVFLRNLKDNL